MKKTTAIKHYPSPKNVKKLQQFLGLVSYFRKFIKNFATKCAPLTNLLKKDVTFKINEIQEKSFQLLKNELINEPILQLPDYRKNFILTTDACKDGLGAILSQYDDDKKKNTLYLMLQDVQQDMKKITALTIWKMQR